MIAEIKAEFDSVTVSILEHIHSGRAKDLDEAEELVLDESLPEIIELVSRGLTDAELLSHPLIDLLRARGMRGREDSIL